MARPAKVKVDYFPHVTHTGKTIAILEARWGNDGYAFWFKLLELLGDSNEFSYNCNNSSDWEYLLSKARVTEVAATAILDKLSAIGAIDADLWSRRIIWSDNFVRNLEPVFERRKTKAPRKPGARKNKTAVTPPEESFGANNPGENDDGLSFGANNSEKNAVIPTEIDKVKESKGEESRAEQSRGETTTPQPPAEVPIETGSVDEVVAEKANPSGQNDCSENGVDEDFAAVVQLLTQNICPVSNSIEADTVREWTETLPHTWVIEAIRQAALSKARSIKYVDKILQSWRSKYQFEDCPWLEEGRKTRASPVHGSFAMTKLEAMAQEEMEHDTDGNYISSHTGDGGLPYGPS